jgi:hypothetical protein
MKSLSLILSTLLLLPLAASAQALPESPTPAPDPAWLRIENLASGAAIVVRNDNGPPVHCLFSSATDAYLFCNPPGNPPGVGFRFDRASVIAVDLDLPQNSAAQFAAPRHNYHPVWLSSIIAGGLIVGLVATRTTDAGGAAQAGAIGAAVVAAIGAPLAFLPRPESFASGGPAYPQYGVAVSIHSLRGPRLHRVAREAQLGDR